VRTQKHARRVIVISNLGIQGVKGQGPSPPVDWPVAIPVTGQRKRAWRSARPFEIREGGDPYRYREISPLICCAWQSAT